MLAKFFLFLILFLSIFGINETWACLSITDDNNLANPNLIANFNLQPDVNPFTDCWSTAFRIRSNKGGWRLTANREGPEPITATGDPDDFVKARDITLEYSVKSFGDAPSDGAVLVSPFASKTELSSIRSGTFIISGIKRSSNNCSSHNIHFYKLTKTLCLFHDFVFNPGQYLGQVSYLLVAP